MKALTEFIKTHIPVLSLLLSTVVAWLLVPLAIGLPMVPFFLFFVGLGTIVFLLKSSRSWFDVILYLGILLLSAFLLIRADEVIVFIDFLFIIFFGSLLVLPLTNTHTLTQLLITPLSLGVESLLGKNRFPYSWSFLKKNNTTAYIPKYLPSILVTILFLGITTPLLASANPFFSQLVKNTLLFFDLSWLGNFFFGVDVSILIIRLFVLVILSYMIPRILSSITATTRIKDLSISLPINYLIPKVAMGLLLVVFFITQTQLYFASPEVLQSMGYTHSRLTNEVFFQVTLVAFIIFFLAYLDKERKTWNRMLTYFLMLEAFFLVGIAFKSVFDYSFLWGLTQKRLWGYATMTWLTGALILFLYHYVKQTPSLHFFRLGITYTIIVLLGVNLANFDYLIAHYSTARTPSGTDYVYLARRSPDSHYYRETLTNLMSQIETSNHFEAEKTYAAHNVLSRIDNLKQKYSGKIPLNSYNFSEYQEYLNVRDLNTDSYRAILNQLEQKYTKTENLNPQQP